MIEKIARLKPLIDLSGLIVLFATMVGVFWYACAAHQQNHLLGISVAEEVASHRPVIMANGAQPADPKDAIPTAVGIAFRNFGPTVAVEVTDRGYLVTAEPGDPTPLDSECDEKKRPQREKRRTAIAPSSYLGRKWTPLSANELDEVKGGSVLYATGCVYYLGLDGNPYFSDICMTWSPNRNPEFQACADPKRNYVH